jgi:hypothetical protein
VTRIGAQFPWAVEHDSPRFGPAIGRAQRADLPQLITIAADDQLGAELVNSRTQTVQGARVLDRTLPCFDSNLLVLFAMGGTDLSTRWG